jgi:molecular chaperone GrpE (heat shock protein)
MSEYIRLLNEIKESIKTNKIILKDSNKMIPYFDTLAHELPIFKSKMEKIDARIEKLKDKDKVSIINKVKEKETENKINMDQLEVDNQRKNDLLRSKADFENSIKTYLLDIEEQFQRLSTKKYKLMLGSE